MDETPLSVFHSVLNRAHRKRGSVCFQLVFFFSFTLHDLTDFLRREGDRQRAALK